MSHVTNCGIDLACNVPVGAVDSYLWYIADTALGSVAQRLAVAAEIAAGQVPTAYNARTPGPAVRIGPFAWPSTLWAFVTAAGTNGACVLGSDTLVKDVTG